MRTTTIPAGLLVAFSAGCSFQGADHWTDQLVPAGPCWEVNLVDGIDESSATELHDLFACINQSGNFDGLSPLDAALDAPTRSGQTLGVAVARLANTVGSNGVALLQWVGTTIEIIIELADQADLAQDAIMEVLYGRPVDEISPSEHRISNGVAVPLLRTIGAASSLLLDGGPATQEELIDAAESDTAANLSCTLQSTVAMDDRLAALPDRLLLNASRAWLSGSDGSNNTVTSVSGNSIRDLIAWADIGGPTDRIGPIREDLRRLLDDEAVRSGMREALRQADAEGHLIDLPSQFVHLANVDPSGRPLDEPGAEAHSALEAGVRLMDAANREVECTVPVLGLSVDLGNLSVEILKRIASAEPGELVARLDLLQGIWGLGLTQIIAETLASSGACDGFDRQMLDDMRVIERLSDPPVADLAVVLHGFMDAVYEAGEHDRLVEAVNVLAFLHSSEAMPVVQEALRDLSETDLMGDAIALFPILIEDPVECTDGRTTLGFDDLWSLAQRVAADNGSGHLSTTVLGPLLTQETTWETIKRLAILGSQPNASLHDVPRAVANWVADSEDPPSIASIVPFLQHPTAYVDALTIAENEVLNAALTDTGPNDNPLSFTANIILNDTVTVMLQTLHLVLDTLGVNQQNSD